MKTAIFRIPYTEHIIFPKNSKLKFDRISSRKKILKKKKERKKFLRLPISAIIYTSIVASDTRKEFSTARHDEMAIN